MSAVVSCSRIDSSGRACSRRRVSTISSRAPATASASGGRGHAAALAAPAPPAARPPPLLVTTVGGGPTRSQQQGDRQRHEDACRAPLEWPGAARRFVRNDVAQAVRRRRPPGPGWRRLYSNSSSSEMGRVSWASSSSAWGGRRSSATRAPRGSRVAPVAVRPGGPAGHEPMTRLSTACTAKARPPSTPAEVSSRTSTRRAGWNSAAVRPCRWTRATRSGRSRSVARSDRATERSG